MLDLHCHILFGVDDGAPDLATALDMGRALVSVGYHTVAASPHYGSGPGGDVDIATATRVRAQLNEAFAAAGVTLRVVANAEHHVTAELFERVRAKQVVPIGGDSSWLLVELPWQSIPNVEDVLFRLQLTGYQLLLAHPERYTYLSTDTCARLVERNVKMQLELGSFTGAYGARAQQRAEAMMARGLSHVLATDLHRPKQAEIWLAQALAIVRNRYGAEALARGVNDNPHAMVANASADRIEPLLGEVIE